MDPHPRSPLLDLPDAVDGEGADAGVAAHYGSFNGEQRTLAGGNGFVDLSHRGVVRVEGPDRLTWLHSLTTQQLEGLAPGEPVITLVLSPQGHVEHALYGVDDGTAFTAHVEPGRAADLVDWLDRMRFLMRVEVTDVTSELAVAWRPVEPRRPVRACRDPGQVPSRASGPAGRLRRGGRPGLRHLGLRGAPDRARRTAPRARHGPPHHPQRGRLGRPRSALAVHLDKGCYRGQETVARVHTLGRPPRRLTLLHLDGSENRLPAQGTPLVHDGRQVGVVGSSARHHELGPIALGLVKRNVPLEATLDADGMPVAQEVVVDPEVGLHVRPDLR